MARHVLKTPVLVGVAAIAVISGVLSLREDSDVVDVVPPCTAPQGQFCLQMGLGSFPWDEDDNRNFDLVFIKGDRSNVEAAFVGLDVELSKGDLDAGSGARVSGLSQAKFDAIPADYRVSGAKDQVRLNLDIGNYMVCAYTPQPSSFRGGPNTASYCEYIVFGHKGSMNGNTYVEGLDVDVAL